MQPSLIDCHCRAVLWEVPGWPSFGTFVATAAADV
jgi:hypothetical protein